MDWTTEKSGFDSPFTAARILWRYQTLLLILLETLIQQIKRLGRESDHSLHSVSRLRMRTAILYPFSWRSTWLNVGKLYVFCEKETKRSVRQTHLTVKCIISVNENTLITSFILNISWNYMSWQCSLQQVYRPPNCTYCMTIWVRLEDWETVKYEKRFLPWRRTKHSHDDQYLLSTLSARNRCTYLRSRGECEWKQ
jgi:hypothetical protein